MLRQEEDVGANALHRRGWTITAIARHVHKDRKTIRAYVTGQRTAGVRMKPADHTDAFGSFARYTAARLAEDLARAENLVRAGHPGRVGSRVPRHDDHL